MANPYLGEIRIFPYNFSPMGWALCEGQTMPISQNTALFALLGTTYGGNGTTTFNLPDLRGRAVVGAGEGPGLSNYVLGEDGGAESVTLTSNQMPAHNHLVHADEGKGNSKVPGGSVIALGKKDEFSTVSDGSTMNAGMIANTGGSQPAPILSPFLVMTPCIALQGIFPSRS